MNNKSLTTILLVMITATLFVGCSKEPPKQQAVVLNLGEIADKTGITEQMKEHTKTINQQISEEIRALSTRLNKEIEDEKASLVDKPSEDGEKKLRTMQEQLKKQIAQIRLKGNARRTKEISSFVDNIMSVAQEVASEIGASIILKAAVVHWFDDTVDITDEVIARINRDKNTQPVNSLQN